MGGGGGLHCFEALAVILYGAWQPHCDRARRRSRQDEPFKLSELFPKEHGLCWALQLVCWSCAAVSSAWAKRAKPGWNTMRTWTTTCHPWASGENTFLFPMELWLLCLTVFPLKLASLPPICVSDSRVGSWSLTKLINKGSKACRKH